MAQVSYAHVEAPRLLRIDGVIAFQPGDPVPVDTARRLGLLEGDDAPEVIGAVGIASSPQFTDAEIKVAAAEAAAGANLADGTPAPDGTTPPTGDATTVTPPQAPATAPRQGQRSTPTT